MAPVERSAVTAQREHEAKVSERLRQAGQSRARVAGVKFVKNDMRIK
jgi:hypothetical protein